VRENGRKGECTHSRLELPAKCGRLGCSMLDQASITLESTEDGGALVEAGLEEEVVCAGGSDLMAAGAPPGLGVGATGLDEALDGRGLHFLVGSPRFFAISACAWPRSRPR
jgi:hypothetical protein